MEGRPLGWVHVPAGSLPFALVHGESLVAAAAWALGEAGIMSYDAAGFFHRRFAAVREAGLPLVVHDPLCPLAPPGFLAEAVDRSASTGRVVVGFRPVTDTIKRLDGDAYAETLDRSALRSIATPVVIPTDVLAGVTGLEPDVPALVDRLAGAVQIEWLEAPPLARRVADLDDLAVLEAASRAAASTG